MIRFRDMAGLDRRSLLRGALQAGLVTLGTPLARTALAQAPPLKSNPFTLGVASGDPSPDGFVIWTRLAPEPLQPRGGMIALPREVSWEVATDPAMTTIVQSGIAVARIELAHSVHVEIEGLAPARDYFYRFRLPEAESPIGRARTFPAAGADVAQMRFASAGCQEWDRGFYTAWRAIAQDHLDFVFHYGDYIYENAYAAESKGVALPRTMPKHFATCYTLPEYRQRYALYKTDPDLQAAHAACPFLPSFDDHEVMDNWAGDRDKRDTPPEAFLFRRAAAFQAWYEHMPVRCAQLPRGPDMLAFRRLAFGRLADIAVLDTRQYRSKQPCGDGIKACPEADQPSRTMMGAQQERWFAEGLRGSRATWQVLAQQVMFAPLDWRSFPWLPSSDVPLRSLDKWDGASAARDRVMQMLREAGITNTVVLTGDLHKGVALELKQDWRDPASQCVGVEFLATSISSDGDGFARYDNEPTLFANNPHLKFFSNQRGYIRHVVTPARWQADYRVVDRISVADGTVSTAKSFVTLAGKPGLVDA
ncbi:MULTISPECIES: alkaline phosphatase D family protein [unclassified Bradyrhizobium]|uniref:alkaline phosphatase D family protein n=1 Tax=unclassified Bradyrhizobium TaxID=2631580 RepID=UPI0028E8E2AD|nr:MULTISPECIES: alkaline phosphatase D family protein [unclassified Bradyrhizobium]